jgi:hypothetical protein
MVRRDTTCFDDPPRAPAVADPGRRPVTATYIDFYLCFVLHLYLEYDNGPRTLSE